MSIDMYPDSAVAHIVRVHQEHEAEREAVVCSRPETD